MAEKIKITLEVDDKGSVKAVNTLNDKLGETSKIGKQAEDAIEKTAKQAAKGESSFKKLGSSIKGGFAVGAVVKALDMLGEGLMSNQKTQNLFNEAIAVFQGLINGTVEVLEPFFKVIMKAFTSPKQAWDDLVDAFQAGANWINENIIEGVLNWFVIRINNLKIGFLEARKAWNDLTRDFEESAKIQDQINKLTEENTQLTKENNEKVENIVAVYEKVKKTVVDSANTIAAHTKKAFDNKDVLANAEFNLNRLAAVFTGIVEKYDLLAEKQRQIRDDETKTIEERIAANEELAKVLDEGEQKEKENIQARIGIIQQQQNLLGNTKERQLEILALTQELTGVEAKYAGLRSEQLTNINALNKEGIELKRAEAEGTIEANAIIAQSNADALADTLEGFELKKQALQEEFMARRAMIDQQIAGEKEGTQAYIDAVNERKVLDAQYAADVKALVKETDDFKKEKAEADKQRQKEVAEANMEAVNQGITGVQSLLGEDSKFGKALAVAQAVINTYQGASKALAQGGTFGPIAAAGVIAAGLANVRTIMSTPLPEAPSGGGGGGSMAMPSGPSVGIIQGQMSQTSQLQADLNRQMSKPTRAYVVGQNVTSQQSLDRHIQQNATL